MKYVNAAVIGGLAGVLVGLLLAPGPGRRTRRRLSRRFAEDKEALVRSGYRAAGGLSEYLYDQFEESKRRLAAATMG